MAEIEYKEQRFQQKKRWYRVRLGVDLLMQYPMLNIIWILLMIGDVALYGWKNKMMVEFDFPHFIEPFLNGGMSFVVILLPLLCMIGIMESLGELRARNDEADMESAFQSSHARSKKIILIKKKKLKRNGVTLREVYTTIPMAEWNKNKEALADQLNVTFVEEFEYGGKENRNGRCIVMKSVVGRKQADRGTLYDDDF